MSSQQAGDLRTPALSHGEPWGESHDYQVGRSIDLSLPKSVGSTHLELTLWQTTCWRPHYCCTSSPSVMECGIRVILGLSGLHLRRQILNNSKHEIIALPPPASLYLYVVLQQSTAGGGTQGRGTQQSTHALTALHLRHDAERNLPVLFVSI